MGWSEIYAQGIIDGERYIASIKAARRAQTKRQQRDKRGRFITPFHPQFDHSKCYYWCGNPYCDSAPNDTKREGVPP